MQQTIHDLLVSLVASIDRFATTATWARRHVSVTRANVVRMLPLRVLDAVDAKREVTP